ALIADVSEVDDIPDETPFRELGIDSVMAVEIVSEVERTYKLDIAETEVMQLTCFQQVYDLVHAKLTPAAS
ncbi:MAG: acyl carrier protein, partial [Polyangiales bacterium]